jgi:hypothetical protein
MGVTETLIIGIGATVVIDLWALVRRRAIGIPLPDYGLVGRWIAHMAHGRFRHESMTRVPPVRGERWIGWAAHYAIGVAFAAILLGVADPAWVQHPTLMPALLVGIATVAAPFLLMQPGMGAGVAARRTPRPGVARLQSVITHAVFGAGLFLCARLVSAL